MRVVETSTYRGPHLYSHRPMIRVQLDLGALEAWPTHRLHGFTDRLLVALPGLERHGCCFRTPGGFVRRLREGTWLGHVIEHVALELQCLAGSEVSRGKTRSVKGRPGVYNILYVYETEGLGRAAGRAALLLHERPAAEQGLHLGVVDGQQGVGDGVAGLGQRDVVLAEIGRAHV